jgi:SAM-dependent methyltransferase
MIGLKNNTINWQHLKEHYELEKKLAAKLRSANKKQRSYLYTRLYNQLFRKLPFHPQLANKQNPQLRLKEISNHLNLIDSYLSPNCKFVEVGAGDCLFSFAVAKKVNEVYAIDVSDELVKGSKLPKNFLFIKSDGTNIPIHQETIDIIFTNQLMEHLHPEDALIQLKNILTALKKGGVYVCMTPNSLTGPHDVSKYFDEVATGFHLKEYTVTELYKLLKKTGFSKIKVIISFKGHVLSRSFPVLLIEALELILTALPWKIGKRVAKLSPLRSILGIKIVAKK